MVHIKNLVPEVYRESRDFNVFLKLLDIIINTQKYDIDNWTILYDPSMCPDKFLPLLADIIGYRYDNTLSVTENRIIMQRFNSMIKNKGSEIGLKIAAALSMNAQLASDPSSREYIHAVSQLQFLDLFYDYETGTISIYYPHDLKKIRDLFKYVRPVGSFIDLIVSEFPEPESDLSIETYATYRRRDFTKPDYTGTMVGTRPEDANLDQDKLQINLGQIERGDQSDRPINNYNSVTVEINGENFTYTAPMIQELKSLIKHQITSDDTSSYKSQLDFNKDGQYTQTDLDYLKKLLLGIMTYEEIEDEINNN